MRPSCLSFGEKRKSRTHENVLFIWSCERKETLFRYEDRSGLWNKKLILTIDEADTAPPELLDLVVGRFRETYLDRESNVLHGLALAGVHAVLGAESERGSPFNVQDTLRVPNFTREEVFDLFRQYQEESGQAVAPEVVGRLFESTRGQPGLTGWFGELLTEKYNPGKERTIDLSVWEDVYQNALHKEWNNTVLNLIKKAQGRYPEYVMELFARSDLHFSIRADWCIYLYLNGIIDEATITDSSGKKSMACRFSSPFVQNCLFDAFTKKLIDDRLPILALEPTDRITDVLNQSALDLAALIDRYKNYLNRLKARGLNPWKEQPRRADMRLTEAVGHFHLYSWLLQAVGGYCVVSPEFPTGNGRVDLHVKCGEKFGIIEVKSFKDLASLDQWVVQTAEYAAKLNLHTATMALFVPVEDENVLNRLSGKTMVDRIQVVVKAICWT